MHRPALLFVAAAVALAQSTPELKLPKLKGDRSDASARASTLTLDDPVSRYQNRREAATAALQAGYKAVTVERNRARAMGLTLISLRRDPNFGKALYNMAVLCEQQQSWQDAIAFYRQAQQADSGADLRALAGEQLKRVQAVAQLESTDAGKKRREFDVQLLAALNRLKDPAIALDEARKLLKLDPSRWESQAIAGMSQASLGAFADSLKSLQDSVRLAPAERRPQIQSALELARRQANFTETMKSADAAWEKQQYSAAAKLYANAWEDSPGNSKVAMQAATGFLLADQVSPAVQVLSQLRSSAPPDAKLKLDAMLKELAAISPEAKSQVDKPAPAAAAGNEDGDVATQIRTLIGPLTTPEMEMTARPVPPLLDDTSSIVPVDDPDLTNPRSNLLLLSTESVFTIYQRDAGQASSATPEAAPSVVTQPAPPQVSPAPAASAPAPASSRPAAPGQRSGAAPSGPVRSVEIASNTSGAVVIVDENPEARCIAPCQMQLSPGRHTLKATLSGYRDSLKIFSVEDRKANSVSIQMDMKGGSVSVESRIAGAPIFVNGTKTQYVTPANLTLAEGTHEIGVQIEGAMKTQTVRMPDGGLLRVAF